MYGRIAQSLGILLLVVWSTPSPAQAPTSIGTVDALVGECTVVRFGQSGASPLAVGAELYEGDRLRTEAGARLRLAFIDGTVVQLGESTDLVLDWFLVAPDVNTQNVLLRVSSGIFRVILELVLPRAAFEVQTSTAVATVRGTDWISEATPAATATVALEGQVAIRNIQPAIPGEVVLGPGEGTTVNAGAPPGPVTVWGDARRNQFIDRTTVP
jgi:ferric-dicitrate binding protein FerR (iron transport regulator)